MQRGKWFYIALGFVAGVAFLIGCGGGGGPSAVAQTVYSAAEISYSNLVSGLSASNVQDAVDELSTKIRETVVPTEAMLPLALVGGTFTDVPGLTLTVNTGNCDLLISASFNCVDLSTGSYGLMRLTLDGVEIPDSMSIMPALCTVTSSWLAKDLAAGSHTINVQFATGASGNYTFATRRLIVTEY